MSFDFSAYPRIEIPEGRVKRIARVSDGIVLWTAGYINQVPLSIDTDGSIYNGVGYMDGYRLSSNGTLKELDSSCVSGLIAATNGDVIRTYGCDWSSGTEYGESFYTYIGFYDAAMNWIGAWNNYGTNNGYSNVAGCTITEDDNGVTTFAPNVKVEYAYIRISLYGSGADMVITVNEEITG